MTNDKLREALVRVEHEHWPSLGEDYRLIFDAAKAALAAPVEAPGTLACGHHESLLVRSVESDSTYCAMCDLWDQRNDAVTSETELRAEVSTLKAKLAAPVEAEPVAWWIEYGPKSACFLQGSKRPPHHTPDWQPLYAHPAEQGKDAEDATTEARAENREPVIVDSVHSAGAYFDWGQPGCGFGQMSFSYKEGAWEFDTECMGPRWTRKCLHALADHVAGQFEQQHSAARNAKPAKGG